MQGTARTRISAIWFGSAILAGTLFFAATPAFADDDYFLKLDGVTGESKDVHHVGWIKISGYDMNAAIPSSGTPNGGGGGGKAVESMKVTKPIDNTSNILFNAVTTGKHFKTATIEAVKASGQGGQSQNPVVSTITMQEVFIVAFNQSGTSSGLVDTMTLRFGGISTTPASQQSSNGKLPTPQIAAKNSNFLRQGLVGKTLKSP